MSMVINSHWHQHQLLVLYL